MLPRSALALLLLAAPAWAGELTVYDGDTIKDGKTRLRIENIDAAELDGECDAEIMLADVTRRRLIAILAEGEPEIEQTGTDFYRRPLVRVRVNGEDVGERLVEEGYAREWRGRREDWCSSK